MRTAALAVAVAALSLTACKGTGIGFVPQSQYDRDTHALQEQVNELQDVRYRYEVLEGEHQRTVAELERLRGRNDAFDALSADLRTFLNGLQGVTRNPDGSWSFEVDLLFRPGSFAISDNGRRTLQQFCGVWKNQPVRFRIVGHTDCDPIRVSASRVDLTQTNLELGALRACAVMGEFLHDDIEENRMVVESQGNNSPRAPNDGNADNKRHNRRVEIYVLRN